MVVENFLLLTPVCFDNQGDAWQHEGRVRALQQLLMQRGLDQLALVDGREPWYKRLWAQLLGPAEA